LPDAAQERVVADHHPDDSISAIGTSKTRPASFTGLPSVKIPKWPNSTVAGEVAEANNGL
jgi:hypothetical protein